VRSQRTLVEVGQSVYFPQSITTRYKRGIGDTVLETDSVFMASRAEAVSRPLARSGINGCDPSFLRTGALRNRDTAAAVAEVLAPSRSHPPPVQSGTGGVRPSDCVGRSRHKIPVPELRLRAPVPRGRSHIWTRAVHCLRLERCRTRRSRPSLDRPTPSATVKVLRQRRVRGGENAVALAPPRE
jgi:hypothetical protein